MKDGAALKPSAQGQHTLLFLLCFTAYVTAYLGRLNYSACLSRIVLDCGFTRAEGGMTGTAFFMVYGLCQLINGMTGDHIKPQHMIAAGLAGSGAVNLLFPFCKDAVAMAVIWSVNGLFQAMLWPPIIRIFAEWFHPEYRKAACLRINITTPVGTVAAYLAAAAFIRMGNWRGSFYMAGILMLLTAGIWMWIAGPLAESPVFQQETRPGKERWNGDKAALSVLFVRAGIPTLFMALVAQGVLKDGITTWVPSFAEEQFGISPALSVLGTVILPIANISGVYLASSLERRIKKGELAASGALFAVNVLLLGLLLFLKEAGLWVTYLLLAFATTGMMGVNTLFASCMPLAFAPWRKASSAAGIFNFCIYIGAAISVWGTGLLSTQIGWDKTVLCWCAVSVLGGILCAADIRKWNNFVFEANSRQHK